MIRADFELLKKNVASLRNRRNERRALAYRRMGEDGSAPDTQENKLLAGNSDASNPNNINQAKAGLEIVEWERLSGEVFRKPFMSVALCCLLGAGVQMIFMVLITITSITFGMISPAHREYLYIIVYFTSAFFGNLNGYVAAKFYKFFNGTSWI